MDDKRTTTRPARLMKRGGGTFFRAVPCVFCMSFLMWMANLLSQRLTHNAKWALFIGWTQGFETDTPFQRDPELGPDFAGCNVPNGVKGALYCIDAACACLDSSKSKDNPKQILGGIRSW
eukprot:7990469-Pyramimonas_sp.AAC.2